MSNKKATKRALLTSITALAMCVVMLVGTTFAWFTDTATANVNKIQAGNLDVALEMLDGTNWVTAEGQTLNFVKAAGGESQAILWEPGAEYKLPELRVRNDGNLALKYEVAITGAVDATPNNGVNDLELLDVITFRASTGGGTATSGVYGKTIATGALNKNGDFQTIQLSAKMDENAGNKYQEMAISGIAITVKAMQVSYEYDSNGNTYDDAADMTPDNLHLRASANVTKTVDPAQETEFKSESGTVSLTAPAGSIATKGDYTLSVVPMASGNITAAAGTAVNAYDIKLKAEDGTVVTAATGTTFTVQLKIGAGLKNVKVFHNGTEITPITYDETAGIVTFTTDSFSIFDVQYDAPTAMIVGGECYTTLADAVAAAKDGDTITLLKNTNGNGIRVATEKFATRGLTVNFNGHSYTVGGVLVGSSGTGTNAFQLLQGGKVIFKNGSIVGVAEGTKPAEDTPDWHGAPAIMIQNYCDLTLDNMIVTGGDQTVYTMSNNCGNIVINNTTINAGKAQGYGSGPFAFDVYGGWYKDNVTVTVKGNSVINGDIELDRDTKNPSINTLILGDCAINGNILKSDGTLNFAGNVTLNGNVNVTKNKDDAANYIRVTGATTLNLNGKIITPDNMGNNNTNFTALIVDADTAINAGVNGGIDTQTNGGYAINVRNGATLTINGGTYYGGGTAVQVQKGTLVINDGTFEVEPYSDPTYGYKFLINCIDAAYKDGTAKIMVRGGSFVNYDPSDSASENPRGNFVDEGYSCTENNGVWTVTKNG